MRRLQKESHLSSDSLLFFSAAVLSLSLENRLRFSSLILVQPKNKISG